METTAPYTILSAEKLKALINAVCGPLGFLPSYHTLDGSGAAEGPSVLALPQFGLAVELKGPESRRDEVKAAVERMSREIAEQEREASSLAQEIMLRYEQLSLLFGMSERLGQAQDNKARMQTILETAAAAVSAQQGCLLVNGSDACLKGSGDLSSLRELATNSARTGKPLIDEKLFITLPLTANGANILGAIALGPKRRGLYRSGDLKLLGTLAAYSSLLLESGRLYEDLERLFFSTIQSMVEAVDAKDPSTHGHSERVRQLTVRIAERMGLDPREVKRIELAALLHDVGKIGLPDRILHNITAELTPEQWELVRQHPQIGVSILSHVGQLADILPAIGQHHERFDGTGYPLGIRGPAISHYARIIAVADSYDAMTMERTYRTTFTRERAIAEIRDNAGKQFDPAVAEAFVACCTD